MPLLSGMSKEVIEANVAELIRAGHSPEQAVAIAHAHARRRHDVPHRARATAMYAAALHSAGLGARRRRMPLQQPPNLIELAFGRELEGVVHQIRLELAPLFAAMPDLIASARVDLGAAARADAGEAARIRELLAQARDRMSAWMNDARMRGIIEKYADRAQFFQRAQLARQLKASLGVDAMILDRNLRARLEGFVEENLSYIQDLSASTLGAIERMVINAVATGREWMDVAKELEKRFEIANNRARFIARDQIGKLVGRLNAERQQELGISHYIWRTRKDELVRPTHARREGHAYAWSGKGAAPILPGMDWNCRCFAEPVMDGVLGDLSTMMRSVGSSRRPGRARGVGSSGDLPSWKSLGKEGKIVTVPARALIAGGLDLSSVSDMTRLAKVRGALLEGKEAAMARLEPPEVVMNREGKIVDVVGGRHRILASSELDRPITIRISRAFEPEPVPTE